MSSVLPPVRDGLRSRNSESQRFEDREADTAIMSFSPGPGARLCFTAGPREGEELILSESADVVVGRATQSQVAIPDPSVSRRHALLRRVGGGWSVSDLGSGNGTLVNGDLLAEERPLVSGDLLTFGDSELRFEEGGQAWTPTALTVRAAVTVQAVAVPRLSRALSHPGSQVGGSGASDAAPSARRQAPRRMRLLRAAGALASLLVLLAALKVKREATERRAQQAALADSAQAAQAGALFQEAKRLVREGRWREAKARLDPLAAERPDYPGVRDYLERAAREVPNEALLADARSALGRNALGPAAAALARVTPDTLQYDALHALRAQLLSLVGPRVLEARRLLEARELDAARAVTADVLLAFPEQRDAQLLDAQALQRRRAPVASPKGPAPRAWEPAVARFIEGNLPGAVALARGCAEREARCRGLLAQLSEFEGLYRQRDDLDARGLGRLLQLDRDITDGRPSRMARTAGMRAAGLFYSAASAARASGQWGRAGEYARRTLQVDPGHSGAADLLSELRTRAKDLYLSAYSLKDTSPDEALPRFREVLQLTSPHDETYEKARGWVEKLSR